MIEDPIRDESPSWVNANIDRETLARLESMKDASPEEIEERVDELAWEYDVSCATTVTLATFSLAGLALSRLSSKFLAVPAIASGLLVWENLPVPSAAAPLFRRLGFRSRTEIERERHALKMLRGDYRRAEEDPTAKGALTSAQAEGKVLTTKKTSRRGKRNLGAPAISESENLEDLPLGEDLRPMDEPPPSGPSGNPSRH
jgi:hypothetical protein